MIEVAIDVVIDVAIDVVIDVVIDTNKKVEMCVSLITNL